MKNLFLLCALATAVAIPQETAAKTRFFDNNMRPKEIRIPKFPEKIEKHKRKAEKKIRDTNNATIAGDIIMTLTAIALLGLIVSYFNLDLVGNPKGYLD